MFCCYSSNRSHVTFPRMEFVQIRTLLSGLITFKKTRIIFRREAKLHIMKHVKRSIPSTIIYSRKTWGYPNCFSEHSCLLGCYATWIPTAAHRHRVKCEETWMFNSFLINHMINLLPFTQPTRAQHDMHNTKYSTITATCFGIRKPSPECKQIYFETKGYDKRTL
jgi:hypothetical protein